MSQRSLISTVAVLCTVFCATTAHAQIGSSCLRPLGIPDRWIERQTPPWDPTDTFDPTGPEPDLYYDGYGFNALEDEGRPMSLVLYDQVSPLKGESAWPMAVGDAGLFAEIVGCSGYLHFVGAMFPGVQGATVAPFGPAFAELIAQDPDAMWDPAANGGRGGVVNSAYTFSPRVIALPVFAPDSYASAPPGMSPAMIKIVGFFVSQRVRTSTGYSIAGYLTGWSHVETADVTGRLGEYVQLSAKVTAPGSPIVGLPIEFLHGDTVVATAATDGTGTARTMTTDFQLTAMPGDYPGAIRARLRDHFSFFTADEASARLTVLKKLPFISWPPLADIVYGTPLGAAQLNATADAAGTFTYSPAAGTVPGVSDTPQILTVTFVPAEEESEIFDTATATTFITVNPAPLTLAVTDVTKLYLDPLPSFATTATGFVNGDGPSAIDVSPGFMTSATAASGVGTYAVVPEWYGAANYTITLKPGVLTIVPRPTVTALQMSGPSPSTYGQALTFTIAVSSGIGDAGGTVTLLSGGVPLAAALLAGGQATVSVSSLDSGTHAISASYAGSSGFAGSRSSSIVHTVVAAGTTTSLSSSINPSRAAQPVTFTATVTTDAPGAAAASGSVEFLRDGVVMGVAALNDGTAVLTTDTLPVGKHTIQARYLGTSNHRASASALLQQTVKGGGK